MSGFLYIASPQKGDLRLLGPPSGRGADGGARIRDRRVPADLRADSQATVPSTPPIVMMMMMMMMMSKFPSFPVHIKVISGFQTLRQARAPVAGLVPATEGRLASHCATDAPVVLSHKSVNRPQQGDLRLSGPPSGQDAGGGARTRDRRVPADLRADSLATVPPTPHQTSCATT
ncbi:TBC1 domain family member 2b [Plakobranchus ocellatus]|uniref:TBC1 domain family member 2b n=1 Tax=Plakobranchus ocellatus TaxID=259542 RepID=A0AAV3ZEM7_9GAST|nr:TBC1 domain family member 2b [Plakobranchus ocellatus]